MSKVAFVQDGVVILGIGDTEEERFPVRHAPIYPCKKSNGMFRLLQQRCGKIHIQTSYKSHEETKNMLYLNRE